MKIGRSDGLNNKKRKRVCKIALLKFETGTTYRYFKALKISEFESEKIQPIPSHISRRLISNEHSCILQGRGALTKRTTIRRRIRAFSIGNTKAK